MGLGPGYWMESFLATRLDGKVTAVIWLSFVQLHRLAIA